MPRYEVEHVCPLTEGQKDEIAAAITDIHANAFTTPRFFVTLRFTDVSSHATYSAGKRRASNRIWAYTRHNATRPRSAYESVAQQITTAWNRIAPLPQISRSAPKPDTELRIVMFFPLTASYEGGLMVPEAGQDKEWMGENMEVFRQKAAEGDGEFADLVAEVEERGLLK